MIYKSIIKEALDEEKFKKFIYNKIIKEYYIYYNIINYQMFFQKKDITEGLGGLGGHSITNYLIEEIGGNEKYWVKINNIVKDLSNEAHDILFKANKAQDYKLDLYGSKPELIKKYP